MIDPGNTVNLVGGLTTEPEVHQNKVARLRLAVDYAGTDRKNPDNRTGYFNVTFFLDDDAVGLNKHFIAQIRAGELKVGTQLHILGSLRHERWETDDGKAGQSTVVIAESIKYAGSKSQSSDDAPKKAASGGGQANAPISF